MSKPAARMGDTTSHGGTIALGYPTVLIGGQPAARVTDVHVCPMVTGVVPHVGGPVVLGSFTVLIGNMPAARVGDMATCVGPPDTIAMGCFTVLIGDAGSGSASGGGAPGMSAAAGAQAGASVAITDTNEAVEKLEQAIAQVGETATVGRGSLQNEAVVRLQAAQIGARAARSRYRESSTTNEHWIEFDFVDKAGLPVSGVAYRFTDPSSRVSEGVLGSRGMVRRDAVPAGQGEVVLMTVSRARWSQEKARVGEAVKLSAAVEGFPPGTPAVFQVYRHDVQGPHAAVAVLKAETQADRVEVKWTFAYPEETEEIERDNIAGYSAPQFYFEVEVRSARARSGLLAFDDTLEVLLKDGEGRPIGNEAYILTFSNGEVRKGTLDASGSRKEENVPPAHWSVTFPNVKGFFKDE